MLRRAQHDMNAGRPAPVEGRSWKRVFGLLLLLPILTACLGRATPPELVKLTQAQNEVLGKFARQVGERELNILLRDPNDPTLPGIPVGDLLYILSRVNEDKLIRLVKGISATTTLELMLSIKRVACTRYDAIFPGNNFDARSVASMNQCTWQHFHLPNLMVQLLNGVNDQGLQTLIDTVNHSYVTLNCASNGSGKLDANQPLCPASDMVTTQPITTAAADFFNKQPYKVTIDHYSYLMKLAYIVVGFDTPSASDPNLASPNLVGPTKLYNLMNLTLDGRDMAYLLDSFDSNTVNLSRETPQTFCPAPPGTTTSNCVYIDTTVPTAPVYNTYDAAGNLWRDICPTLLPNNACNPTVPGVQLQGLRNLLSLIDNINDTSKLGTLLNGRRTTRNDTSQDTGQIRYFTDRLRPVIEHRAPAACVFPGSPAEQAMQDFRMPHGGSGSWNAKLAELINRVSNMDRMMDLIYNVDDGFTINHTTGNVCPERGIDNLMVLLNNINNVDAHINDLTGYNPPYTNLTPNTQNTELITVAYLIDNVILDPLNPNPAKRNKLKYLIEYVGDTLAVLQLACYTAVADNNPVGIGTCANRGLINQVADGSKLDDSSAPDLTAAGKKLVNLMGTCLPGVCATDGVHDIESMRFLIRNVSMANLNGMLKGLLISATQATADLINQVKGPACWNVAAGIIETKIVSAGSGYTSPPVVLVSAPPSMVNTNLNYPPAIMAAGTPAVVKSVIETDTINFAASVGQVKDIVIINSGSGYYNYPPFTLNPPTLTVAPPPLPPPPPPATIATATATVGSCSYNAPLGGEFRGFPSPSGSGATGLGKLVNIINYITGSPKTVVDLINGVTDGTKLGILINGVSRSSNLVGVINAVLDPNRNNNATINELINLMNTLSRADVGKLVHIIENLGDAREVTALLTVPSADHDLVAQLMAPYCRTDASGMASATCPVVATGNLVHPTSGIGIANLANLVGALTTHGGGGYTDGATIKEYTTGAIGQFSVPVVGGVTSIEVTNPGSNCSNDLTVSLSPPGGAGTTAQATPVVITNSTGVAAVNITDGGTGYSTDPNDPRPVVTFTSVPPCAVDPVATAHISGGSVTSVSIINSGRGCSPGMTVNFVGGVYTTAAQGTVVFGGAVQRVNILNSGSGYTSAPTVTFSGTCSTMPQATAYINGIGSIAVIDKGTIGAKVRSFNFSPGGAANITATVSGSINTTPGLGLVSIYGGSGYTTGDTCPITGAGGSGATCSVIESGGVLTGCSTISGGNNYASGRIVKIGGRASAVATVVAGGIAAGLGGPGGSGPGGIKIVNTGCGYTAPPVVRVVGCAVEPQAIAVMNGSMVEDINVTAPGTGCSSGAKVIIGDVISQAYVTANVVAGSVTSYTVHSGGAGYGASATATILGGHCTVQPTATVTLTPSPNESVASVNVVNPGAGCSATEPPTVVIIGDSYAPHADGATAIVDQVTGGYVSAMSVSDASVNAAQLVQLIDRDATGNGIAINYAYSSLAVGGISAREALVRLLHHGVTPQTHQSMSFYNGVLGATGPAGGVPGRYLRDWPGIGTAHIAGAILNNVDLSSTQTLINLINSNSTTLVDLNIMLGCGDRSQYSNAWTTFTWEQLCRESGPGLW